MNKSLCPSADCYGVYSNDKIIGFVSVMHFPHPKIKNLKKINRMVIHPDFQGCGIGMKVLETVAEHYFDKGYEFAITTAMKNLQSALTKRDNWVCTAYDFSKMNVNEKSAEKSKSLKKNTTFNIKRATFRFKGGENNGKTKSIEK